MIFHENLLLADNSYEISYLIFFKLGKISQNLPSAAVVIGALRVNSQWHTLPHISTNFHGPITVEPLKFSCSYERQHLTLKLYPYDFSMDMFVFVLFVLILYVTDNNFQLCWDGSSWVEPVLSRG